MSLTQLDCLYQAMNRLLKSGPAEVDSTDRAENCTERTVHRITDVGIAALRQWTLELMLDEPCEFPSMPVAIALDAALAGRG